MSNLQVRTQAVHSSEVSALISCFSLWNIAEPPVRARQCPSLAKRWSLHPELHSDQPLSPRHLQSPGRIPRAKEHPLHWVSRSGSLSAALQGQLAFAALLRPSAHTAEKMTRFPGSQVSSQCSDGLPVPVLVASLCPRLAVGVLHALVCLHPVGEEAVGKAGVRVQGKGSGQDSSEYRSVNFERGVWRKGARRVRIFPERSLALEQECPLALRVPKPHRRSRLRVQWLISTLALFLSLEKGLPHQVLKTRSIVPCTTVPWREWASQTRVQGWNQVFLTLLQVGVLD